jgi:hypothetical protein
MTEGTSKVRKAELRERERQRRDAAGSSPVG